MKKYILALLGLCLSTSIFAADLLQVYQQALTSDAAFKEANAAWLAARENLPISVATLLPLLNATGNVSRAHNDSEGGNLAINHNYYNNNNQYSLNITQQILNYTSWMTVKNASNTVKQAHATFNAAAQDLMLRTATAYFAVLQAEDVLRFTRAEKQAVARELDQTKKKYDVGLVPITGVDDAQAQYDTTVADEITAVNNLADQREKLREITKVYYSEIDPLVAKLPLISPYPTDIERWVITAEKQNYDLQATRFASLAAHANIEMNRGGHFPTLNATGSYGYNHDDDSGAGNSSRLRSATAGLSLTVPLLKGGGVVAQTKQAEHQYEKAIATEDKTHSQVASDTRQAYLGVLSGISKIKADTQEIKSNASSLRSTKIAYDAGAGRTMVDVLNAQAKLYKSQKTHAADQYDYLLQTLKLKRLAGTLSPNDLQQINSWIQPQPISTKVTKSSADNAAQQTKSVKAQTSASFYTLQFSVNKKQKTVLKSLERYQLKHKDACFYPKKSDHTLMLCGHYKSMAEAKAVMVKLPKELSKAKITVTKIFSTTVEKNNHAKPSWC